MNDIEIIIVGENNETLGVLDLTDSEDFGFKLTKSIASFKDISKRSTSYSLDFKAPNNDNNNRLLFGINNINATGQSRDILGERRCFVLVNGNQLDSGYIYGLESESGKDYKLFFKGSNNDWLELIGDLELNQMAWRDITTGLYSVDAFEEFSQDRIYTLSSKTSIDYDLTYPIINRNNALDYDSRRPCIHFKAFWVALFNQIGYKISSDFLNSDWINGNVEMLDSFGNTYKHLGLAIDPAFVFTLEEEDVKDTLAEYSIPSNAITFSDNVLPLAEPDDFIGNLDLPSTPDVKRFSRFDGYFTNEVSDDNLIFNVSTSTYTALNAGNYLVNIDFNFWAFFYYQDEDDIYNVDPFWAQFRAYHAINYSVSPPSIIVHVVKDNTQNNFIDGTILQTKIFSPAYQEGLETDDFPFIGVGKNNPIEVVLNEGDNISVMYEIGLDATSGTWPLLESEVNLRWRYQISNNSSIKILVKNTIGFGDRFVINKHIPKGIKVLDLIKDFKNMFNLYFDADTKSKTVFIEPRDNFYYPISEAKDITNSIDFNSNPIIDLSTNYKKILGFAYASDSSDKFIEKWNNFYNRTYAEYLHSFPTQNRFEKGTDTLTLSLFSAAIQKTIEGTSGVITSIVKEDFEKAEAATKGITQKYKPKMFQLIYGQQHDRFGNPLLGELNDPAILVGLMEGYGSIPTYENRKLTFNGVNGLVYDYYLKTLANLDDSGEISLRQSMTIYDFFNLDLKRPVYISSPDNIKGYYLYDAVKNYDVSKEKPVSISLIKYKDYIPADFDATQSTNVNELVDNVPNEDKALKVIVNGLVLDVFDNLGNKLYKI